MSYWGYVADALLNEERGAAERRRHRRARLRQERERKVLEATAAALPKDLDRLRHEEIQQVEADVRA